MKVVQLLLRLAVGLPFLWFGIDKLVHPDYWLSYMPMWVSSMVGRYQNSFMYLQGVAEALLGVLVVLGYFIRPALIFIGLILVVIIATTVRFTELGIRDISLLLSAAALFSLVLDQKKPENLE